VKQESAEHIQERLPLPAVLAILDASLERPERQHRR